MNRSFSVIILIAVLFISSTTFAKSSDDKIADLERQIAQVQRTYMANNQDAASAVAKAQTVQEEFSVLKGQMETNTHLLQAQRDELMRLINDLQGRVQAIEDRMGLFSTQVTAAIGKVSPQAGAEAELYQKALDLANSGNYLEAASSFESFIQKYPKSQFSASARQWVAECFYSSRDYLRAIKEFQIFIEKNPRDPKVPNAVLKQGNAFYELGKDEEARAFYEKVMSAYSGTSEAKQAKAKIARMDDKKGVKGSATTAPTAGDAPTGGYSGSAYPTETIEQQRQKMSGQPPPPAPTPTNKETKKPGVPSKDF